MNNISLITFVYCNNFTILQKDNDPSMNDIYGGTRTFLSF